MLKIILIISFITVINAKLSVVPDFISLETSNYDIPNEYREQFYNKMKAKNEVLDKIWVLNFETVGLRDLKLRQASRLEVEDFNNNVKPSIIRYEKRYGKPKIKKQSPYKIRYRNEDERLLKMEVLKIVNKFLLSRPFDIRTIISKYAVEYTIPTVTLYFKGPYSSLALKHGVHQLQYFIPPPSPLPSWFYREHTKTIKEGPATYVKVPKTTEIQFYSALINLLPTLFSILP